MNIFTNCPYCNEILKDYTVRCVCSIEFAQVENNHQELQCYNFVHRELNLFIYQDFYPGTIDAKIGTDIYPYGNTYNHASKRILQVPTFLPIPTQANFPKLTNTLRLWLTFQ